MSTIPLVALAVGCLLAAGGADGGQEEKGAEVLAPIAPKDDAELWVLIEDAFNPDETKRKAALESLGKADKEQILSLIVYSLGQEPRRERALSYVKLYLKDRRLVPFLATLIKYADGEALRLAVQAAREMPDSRFLPVLMENALDSRHHMQSRSPGPRSTVATFSVFAETAKTLHVITGGKIGLAEYREGDYAEAKRNQLKEEWRAWWGQNEPLPDWAKEVERESALKPKEIKKVADLAGVVCSGGSGERQKAIEELTGQDREQIASAMAWMLERTAFRRRALTVLREQQGLRDPRLLPFLAGVIKHTGGETLLWAVQVANLMPDESLLPALIENALNSEYVRTEAREVGGDRIAYYVVVLSEVGLALHKISKGQIGVDRLTESGLVLEKDKKRLAWREWWERRRER